MRDVTLVLAIGAIALGCAAVGRASAPAAPFDMMKRSNLVALRLQDYEPPPVESAAAATQQQGTIAGLPPEIAWWAHHAPPALRQLLPPGLLPGVGAPAPQPGTQEDARRFPWSDIPDDIFDDLEKHNPNFRVLTSIRVGPELREQLGKLLGDPDNFQPDHGNCMYAEMGLSFITMPEGVLPGDLIPRSYDLLISFSCNQVDSRGFSWPHPNHGLKPATVRQLDAIVQKLWPIG